MDAEITYSLVDEDRAAVTAMRAQAAPFKGKMGDPGARGPFDEIMERTPDTDGVNYQDKAIGGVAGVVCTPRAPRPATAILYLHGGGYLLGSPKAYRHLAGQLAVRVNAAVFVPAYRLAPEHPFPAAVEDAAAAYRGLVAQGARTIVIVGDSAGGGLSLVLLSMVQAEAVAGRGLAPSAAVVMSPWTDLALTGDSLRDRADDDPLLTAEMLSKAAGSYLRGHDPRDPRVSPLYGRLDGLPPIQLHVGTSEILLDDTRRYTERARAANVDATAHLWEGMPHVFPANVGSLQAAERSLEVMSAFILKRFDTKKVLLIGLDPKFVDYAHLPVKLDEATLRAGLATDEKRLRDLGYGARWLLIDRGETAEAVVSAALRDQAIDCVLIGAGIRTIAPLFLLFEKLVNVIHEQAPRAKICFNTAPEDTASSVQRWI